jgi:alkyl sulfatase BDS1-like metallo-beta-lactamase superfamily hydrolase
MERFFDAMATRLDGPRAEGVELSLNFVFTDADESHRLWIQNSVLHHRKQAPDPDAQVTIRITKALMLRLITGDAGTREVLFGSDAKIEGALTDLRRFFSLLDEPDENFAIVRP